MDEAPLQGGLVAAAAALTAWLAAVGAPGMIVGGIAASLLGRPRMTQDVDAMADLPQRRWPELLADWDALLARRRGPGVHDTPGSR